MKTMTVLAGFTEYPDGEKTHRAKGDEIEVTNDRADHLRAAGLARSKPKPKPEDTRSDPD